MIDGGSGTYSVNLFSQMFMSVEKALLAWTRDDDMEWFTWRISEESVSNLLSRLDEKEDNAE